MITRLPRLLTLAIATTAMASPFIGVSGQMPARAPRYAITNARIVTVAGPVIDKGTVVLHDGVIEEVGAAVTAPADALVVDGTGLTVYPGLIDMANTAVVESRTSAPVAAAGAAAGGRGRGAAVATPDAVTWADQEREARARYLNPDVTAAALVVYEGDDLRRLAAAGITSALAVPSQGILRGQSALVNVTAPPDPAETSALATYRRGLVVVRAPVAQHVVFATGQGAAAGGGGGGGGYPGALLGVIAFARQSFLDAQWQKEARAFAERRKEAQVGGFEPALDALAPALDRKIPVAFDASEEREILRALAFAKEFNLDPIIVGGAEAANVIEDLKTAKARVIVSANFQAVGGGAGGRGGGGGGGRGGDADTPLRIVRMRQNAAKVPAALEKAGIAFAFTAGGLPTPGDFVRGVGRTVREGGLAEDAALKALTVNAAKLAGAGDRLGSIEKGKMANVIVTEGSLFDTPRIRHVFVAGWPLDLDIPAQGTGRGGRGSQ